MTSKAEFRDRFRALRDGTSPEDRERWSRQICEQLTAFCVSRRIRHVGVFYPVGSEIDLRPLVEAHPDWTFFFPRISSTHPPRLVWGPEPLEVGLFGIQEPIHAQHFMPPVQLLVVPGLAFDQEGYRVGYGGGFYDAVIERLKDGVITLGVGFDLQFCPHVPAEPRDLSVDGLMTERGLNWFRSSEDPESHR